MKKVILILPLLLMFHISFHWLNAQVYKAAKKLDKTINAYNNIFKYSDGKLFYCTLNGNSLGYIKSNVSFSYPKMEFDTGVNKNDTSDVEDLISVNDTDVFAAGYFTTSNGRFGLVQLKNGNWDTLSYFKNYRCYSILEIQGTLYIRAAGFSSNEQMILKWDMKNPPTVIYKNPLGINLMASHKNNYLVAISQKERIIYDGSKSDTATYYGNYTAAYANTHDSGNLYFTDYNGSVYTLNAKNEIDSVNTNVYTGGTFPNSMAEQDGYLYFGYYNGGLKSRLKITTLQIESVTGVPSNGNPWTFKSGGNIIYGGEWDYTPNGPVSSFYTIMDGAFVSGYLYEDVDSNCMLSSGDKQYKSFRGIVASATDTFPFFSNDTGFYAVTLPIGPDFYRYFVKEKYINNKSVACGIKDSFLVSAAINRNVPYKIQTGIHDARLDISSALGWRVRQGFTESFTLKYRNLGTSKEDIAIELLLPDSFTYDSSSIAPKSISGNKLTFEIKNVPKFTSGQFKFYVKVDVKIPVNSRKKVICKIPVLSGETDSTDNKDTIEVTVRGAYDPNSKHSNPEGKVYSPVKNIEYHIQFQNMGTDTAYRVIVIDTFMPNFPLYKLQMKGHSHPYSIRVEQGNVIIWTFENIKLPPTSENVRASQGYVSFEAPLTKPTQKGQIISNRAHIYFDYQKPVITEWNKVEHSEWGIGVRNIVWNQVEMKVIPNPVGQEFRIVLPNATQGVVIYDVVGNLVASQEQFASEYYFNSRNLKPGVYFIVSGGYKARMLKE